MIDEVEPFQDCPGHVAPAYACFTVKPAKPVLDPPMVAVSTAFQGFLFDVEPVDEYCVEAMLRDVP